MDVLLKTMDDKLVSEVSVPDIDVEDDLPQAILYADRVFVREDGNEYFEVEAYEVKDDEEDEDDGA